jgi:hypothetical protein
MANINSAIKPKWQLYDLNNNPEHNLMRDYIVEFTDIAGILINYYVRDESKIEIDDIYGEPKYQNVVYKTLRVTKMIYEVTEEATLTNGFGINSEDVIQYGFIPKFTWSRDVSGTGYPKPGDVIQTIWNDRSYEVADVGEEAHIFQLNRPIWEFILRPYRFSEQSQSALDIAERYSNSISHINDNQITVLPTDPHILDKGYTTSSPVSAFGDNTEIEVESDDIDAYDDVDTSIYGY